MKLFIRQKLGIALVVLTGVVTVVILLKSPDSLVEVRSSEEIERNIGLAHLTVIVQVITLKIHYFLPLLLCGTIGLFCAVWPPRKQITKQP